MVGAKFTNPGTLKHRLIFQEQVETADGLGGFLKSWAVRAYLWANIAPQNQRLTNIGDNLHQETSHEVIIRFRNDIKAGMRFLYRGRSLKILAVTDKLENQRFLTCLCREEG